MNLIVCVEFALNSTDMLEELNHHDVPITENAYAVVELASFNTIEPPEDVVLFVNVPNVDLMPQVVPVGSPDSVNVEVKFSMNLIVCVEFALNSTDIFVVLKNQGVPMTENEYDVVEFAFLIIIEPPEDAVVLLNAPNVALLTFQVVPDGSPDSVNVAEKFSMKLIVIVCVAPATVNFPWVELNHQGVPVTLK